MNLDPDICMAAILTTMDGHQGPRTLSFDHGWYHFPMKNICQFEHPSPFMWHCFGTAAHTWPWTTSNGQDALPRMAIRLFSNNDGHSMHSLCFQFASLHHSRQLSFASALGLQEHQVLFPRVPFIIVPPDVWPQYVKSRHRLSITWKLPQVPSRRILGTW